MLTSMDVKLIFNCLFILASLGDKGLFSSANQYSSNSRCRLSSSVFMLFSVLPF